MNPYDFAIQMSRDGEKFFRTLIKQVKKPGLDKILSILASDQVIHRCVEICPVKCLSMENQYAPSIAEKTESVYTLRVEKGASRKETSPAT